MRLQFLILVLLFTNISWAKTFTVASEDIHYYPHYDFSATTEKGLGWAILETFSAESGYEFRYEALPVMRIHKELEKGTIDFVYPDNPRWTNTSKISDEPKVFSKPLVRTLGGTMVRPADMPIPIDNITKLAVPLGFSPLFWQTQIDSGQVTVINVPDSRAALQALKMQRADAADVDYFVSQHLTLVQPELGPVALDPTLPVNIVEFMMSTIHHPEVINALNAFLISHAEQIEQIKARYGVKDPDKTFQQIKAAAHN